MPEETPEKEYLHISVRVKREKDDTDVAEAFNVQQTIVNYITGEFPAWELDSLSINDY